MKEELYRKWESILDGVEKSRIPIQFVKKFVCKLKGRKQHTINIQNLLKQGIEPEEIEVLVNRKLEELDDIMVSFEIVLNIDEIAKVIQPETDRLLENL